MMMRNKLKKMLLIGAVLVAMLSAVIVAGCSNNSEPGEGREHAAAVASQTGSGEHGSGGEQGGFGSEEASGATLAPDATFDQVRSGAQLILNYDPASNAFQGTVENTTGSVLTNVRIEVHLSNGTELGPTTPVNLAPGEVMAVSLPSTAASFTGWIAHAEVGSGGESGGEIGSGGQSGGVEHGGGSGGEHGSGGG